MSTPVNHWKLGLFVVVGLAVTVGAVAFFGTQSFQRETVSYKTFFDEPVQGLEVGSPVRFRGVTIGNVVAIDIASDRRHVEVTYELGVKVLDALGLAVEKRLGQKRKLFIPPDLRAQLASTGITGVKFVQLDFFDVLANPPLELPFQHPENYIPAKGSMMKNLEDSVVRAVDQLPQVTQRLVTVLDQVTSILADFDKQGVPQKISATLDLLNAALTQLNTALVALAPGKLSKSAQEALASINTAVRSLDVVLQQVGGERGLAASLQHTSDSLGSMAVNADRVGPAVEDASRDLQGAARAVQRLADALELDPDMLIKGRGKRADK
jgi:paraquat-inducible protein B